MGKSSTVDTICLTKNMLKNSVKKLVWNMLKHSPRLLFSHKSWRRYFLLPPRYQEPLPRCRKSSAFSRHPGMGIPIGRRPVSFPNSFSNMMTTGVIEEQHARICCFHMVSSFNSAKYGRHSSSRLVHWPSKFHNKLQLDKDKDKDIQKKTGQDGNREVRARDQQIQAQQGEQLQQIVHALSVRWNLCQVYPIFKHTQISSA